jgi:sister chromatid cohesion protein DCC1
VINILKTRHRLYLKSSRPTATGTTQALLTTPSKTYRIQQKNSSNPIMMLLPSDASLSYLQNEAIPAQQAGATDNMDLDAQIGSACALPRPSVCMVATIEDTLELIENDEATVVKPVKVNKWHEKFAKSRETSK